MTTKYHQTSLKEAFLDYQKMFINDTLLFFNFLRHTWISMTSFHRNSFLLFIGLLDKVQFPTFRLPFSIYPSENLLHLSIFLGDSAFDAIETYDFLKDDFHFYKVLITYNPRNESTLKKVS